MSTQTFGIQLALETCIDCSMVFAITEEFLRKRRRDHKNLYCPAGHPQHYPGESDLEKARRSAREWEEYATKQKADAERRAQRLREQRDHQERRASAYKGHLTRAKTRAGAGACLFCKREFVNVKRHMASKHQDHVTADLR